MIWPFVTIGDVCMPTTMIDPSDRGEDTFRYVDISSVSRETKTIDSTTEVVGVRAPSRARKEIRRGDVLVSTVRPNLNTVAAVPDELDGQVASTGFCVLRAREKLVNGRFLFHFCRTPYFVSALMSKARGAHYPAVSDSDVTQARFPLVPLSEQRHIIKILDQADDLCRLRAGADAKAEDILPSLFVKMFGNPTINPRKWPVEPLGRLGELDRGRSTHRPRNAAELLGGPYPLIQTGDVANSDGRIRHYTQTYSEFGLRQSNLWPAGTLCITIAANIAKTGVLEFDACFPDSIVGFKPGPRVTTEYVQFLLGRLQSVLERNAPQAAQKNINLEVLRSISIPLPSLSLQQQFTEYVQTYYKSRSEQMAARNKQDRLFSSVLRLAFSGELTAGWREAHRNELLAEMHEQVKILAEAQSSC